MEQNQNANANINLQNVGDRKIRNDVPYKRERLVRVIVQMRNGSTSTGTGFFISKDGEILTCAHVIAGTELRNLKAIDFRVSNNFSTTAESGVNVATDSSDANSKENGKDINTGAQHIKFQNYLTQSIMTLQVELPNGDRVMAEIRKIDEDLDVAVLQITKNDFEKNDTTKNGTPFFLLDDKYTPEYDESTFFCGFQMTGGYDNPTQYPFSVNRAVVSAMTETTVAGGNHEHIQLNSINLGGNSGAPLFVEGSNTVIGIINGNLNWDKNIPLCIAYATSLKLIKEKLEIF